MVFPDVPVLFHTMAIGSADWRVVRNLFGYELLVILHQFLSLSYHGIKRLRIDSFDADKSSGRKYADQCQSLDFVLFLTRFVQDRDVLVILGSFLQQKKMRGSLK